MTDPPPPGRDLAAVLVELVGDRVLAVSLSLGSRGGDGDDHGVDPGTGGQGEHVPEVAVLVGVEFVHDGPGDVEPFLRVRLGREAAENGVGGRHLDHVPHGMTQTGEFGIGGDHPFGLPEHDAGLLPFGGGAVDLGSVSIEEEGVQGQGGAQC